jgi:hypothetical protein
MEIQLSFLLIPVFNAVVIQQIFAVVELAAAAADREGYRSQDEKAKGDGKADARQKALTRFQVLSDRKWWQTT